MYSTYYVHKLMYRNKEAIIDTGWRRLQKRCIRYTSTISELTDEERASVAHGGVLNQNKVLEALNTKRKEFSCRRFGELGLPHLRIGERRSVHRRITIAAAMKSKKS